MKALIQRVILGKVEVDEKIIGEIRHGLVILLGITISDTVEDLDYLIAKCANLRVFDDEDGKMNYSLFDIDGEALVISQFTLCADSKRGRRPSYTSAARPEEAIPLYELFIKKLKDCGVRKVESGKFGADMQVSLVNDGPVTLMIDSELK